MKISPEPLHPLRTWRELWHAGPITSQPSLRSRSSFETSQWKQAKQPAFHWLSQLVNRDTGR